MNECFMTLHELFSGISDNSVSWVTVKGARLLHKFIFQGKHCHTVACLVQKTGEHPRQNDLDVCTVEINVWFILLNGCLVTLCPTCAQGRVRHPRNNPTVDQG